MPDGTIIHTKQQARAIACTAGVAVAVCVALVVVGITAHQVHPSLAKRMFVIGLSTLIGLGFGTLGLRFVRAGIVVYRDRIVVRNIFRSTVVDWDDIEAFAVGGAGLWTIGYVQLRDGTTVAATGIQGQNPALFKSSNWASGPIADLNMLLADQRAGSTSSSRRAT